MISTIEFEALGGTFVQVSAKRDGLSTFAYRLNGLCIDSRFLPPEPSCPDQIFFNYTFQGETMWQQETSFTEGARVGSLAHRRFYSRQPTRAYRRTGSDVFGIAICVPASLARGLDAPLPMRGRFYEGALPLALHLLEHRYASSASGVDRVLEGWTSFLEAEGYLTGSVERPEPSRNERARMDGDVLHALTGVLGAPASRPSLCDLADALGLSERQITRRLQSVLPRIESPSKNFRQMAHRWRMLVAGVLMASRPDERISVIAEHAGFSGTASLDHCFKAAGLEAPTTLVRLVAEEYVGYAKAANGFSR